MPLPSKGPIQVDLNNPQNVAISVATLPHEQDSECAGVEPAVRAADLGANMTLQSGVRRQQGHAPHHLLRLQPPAVQRSAVQQQQPIGCNFPALGTINTQATIGNSIYNSLQTS